MLQFGFPAFLKLAALPTSRKRMELKKRIFKTKKGFDPTRQLSTFLRRFVYEGEPMASLLVEAKAIKNVPQRKAAILALKRFEKIYNELPGKPVPTAAGKYVSPNKLFQVNVNLPLTLQNGVSTDGFAIWNTKDPDIDKTDADIGFELIDKAYADTDTEIFCRVMNLRSPRIYAAPLDRARSKRKFGYEIAEIEKLIETLLIEKQASVKKDREDQRPPKGP